MRLRVRVEEQKGRDLSEWQHRIPLRGSNYDWLVVAGARAKYKCTCSINGEGGYHFMLTAIDGDVDGGGGVDRFRIKISHFDETLEADFVVYDNQVNAEGEDTLEEGTHLGGGSIVVHTNKKWRWSGTNEHTVLCGQS